MIKEQEGMLNLAKTPDAAHIFLCQREREMEREKPTKEQTNECDVQKWKFHRREMTSASPFFDEMS